MDMKILQVLDRLIPYDAFLNDLAARIVGMIKADSNDPEFVSQRKAYELFGRRNVERWKRQGKVESYKRPGKVEYKNFRPPTFAANRTGLHRTSITRREWKQSEKQKK